MNDIPTEVLIVIFNWTVPDGRDIARFYGTCRAFKRVIDRTPLFRYLLTSRMIYCSRRANMHQVVPCAGSHPEVSTSRNTFTVSRFIRMFYQAFLINLKAIPQINTCAEIRPQDLFGHTKERWTGFTHPGNGQTYIYSDCYHHMPSNVYVIARLYEELLADYPGAFSYVTLFNNTCPALSCLHDDRCKQYCKYHIHRDTVIVLRFDLTPRHIMDMPTLRKKRRKIETPPQLEAIHHAKSLAKCDTDLPPGFAQWVRRIKE